MKRWSVADAKAKLSTVLQAAKDEAQIICRRDEPVAVVVSMSTYEKGKRPKRQPLAKLLRRLREIQAQETAEIEVPPRADRAAPDVGH